MSEDGHPTALSFAVDCFGGGAVIAAIRFFLGTGSVAVLSIIGLAMLALPAWVDGGIAAATAIGWSLRLDTEEGR